MSVSSIEYVSYGQQVGYAIASVNYLKGLFKTLPHLHWKTLIQDEIVKYGIEDAFYNDLPEYLKELIRAERNPVASTHQIIHTTPEHFKHLICPGIQNIGMTVWETDRLPLNWPDYFNGLDKLIVPCSWNVDVFKEAKLQLPIYKLPHISQFMGEDSYDNFLNIPASTFVFLNISVWENRKNMESLVDAYLNAFNHKQDVVLILKTSKRDVSAPYYYLGGKKKYIKTKNKVRIMRIKKGLRTAKIIVVPHNLNTDEMKSLYTRANAYVSLSHAEGWGMGQYESAFYGKPVITTNYSGYLDFLNAENSFLIEVRMIDVVPNEWEKNNLTGHQWAEPDMESAIIQMREVYENYEAAKLRGVRLKENVVLNFSAEKINQEFINIIKA